MPLYINVTPNPNYVVGGNNADVVTFSLSLTGSDVILYGNETYVWNFGEVGQPILTGQGPHTIFYRNPSGATGYDVNVQVAQILTPALAGTNGTAGQSAFYYSADTTVYVYEFDSEILGPDYISLNSVLPDTSFFINYGSYDNNVQYPQAVLWTIDGEALAATSGADSWHPYLSLASEPLFTEIREYDLSAEIFQGDQKKVLTKRINVTLGNQVFGNNSLTDATPNLMFFNSSGDNLNFQYGPNPTTGYPEWTGTMIFDANSNETHKTIGLYTFERVDPITYGSTALTLSKFQFFNEDGLDFLSASTNPDVTQGLTIDNVDIVIQKSGFKSKWIFGNNFNTIFPKGTDVWFENVNVINAPGISDFQSTVDISFGNTEYTEMTRRRLWSVVDTMTDGIMVITDTDNQTWHDSNFSYDSNNKGRVFSSDFVRIWYPLNDQDFSIWNESIGDIEGSIYSGKKLTAVNSKKNSQVLTARFRNDDSVNDKYLRRFLRVDSLAKADLPAGYGFQVTLNFKTNKILAGIEPATFIPAAGSSFPLLNQQDLIIFESFNNVDLTPALLTVGTIFEFQDDGSTVNFTKIYTVLQRDVAYNVLFPNETDRKGWTLTTLNIPNIVSDPPTIVVTNFDMKSGKTKVFDVVLTGNPTFTALITAQQNKQPLNITSADMTNLIVQEINKQASGVDTTYDSGASFAIVNESDGWRLTDVSIKTKRSDPTVSSVFNDPYNGQLPPVATIGSNVYQFSVNTIGYIYRRTSSGTYFIQTGYDAVNSLPIWYTISENKLVLYVSYAPNNTVIQFAEDLNCVTYLNETTISFQQTWQNSSLLNLISYSTYPLSDALNQLVLDEQEKMYQRFITQWQSTFGFYGLDLYEENNALSIGRRYTSYDDPNTNFIDTVNDYCDVTILGIRFDSGTAGDTLGGQHFVQIPTSDVIRTCYQFEVRETLVNEYNQAWGLNEVKTSVNYERKTIIGDIDATFGLTVTINGIDYEINFDEIVTGLPAIQNFEVDVEQTLKDFGLKRFATTQEALTPTTDQSIGLKYYEQLESLGVIVKLEKSGDLSGFAYAGTSGYVPYDMLVIQSKFPNVVIDFKILGTDNKHKILHSEIEFLVIQNTLAITIDGTRYSTNGSNIYTILQNWLTQYAPRLFELNIVVEYVDTNRFRFSTLLTSTELVYQIYVGRNAVIGETLYNVTDYRPGNPGVILAGNEIVDPTGGFEANNFATGMLVTITGSKWPLNNQRYNILYVDPAQLVLSYQGPFWNESDVFGDVNDRWNNLYDFSWEAFQDPNINFTFETIGYDTNNGAVVQFTDTSTIPSPVTWIWDYGDGVMYSSNISNFINNVDNPYKPNHTYKSAGKYVVQLTIIDSAAIVHSNTELITALPNHASTNGVAYVNGLVLHTHEFLRYPRENYGSSPNVAYTWSWLDSYPTNANGTDQIFYYDFSGSQLALQNAGIYTYVGTVPLITDPLTNTKIFLNDKPNADLDFVKDASKQQTVFETLTYQLQHVDSSTDVSFEPEPMQIFVGYRSDLEGVNNRTVILNKLEEITLQITTSKKDATNVQTHLPVNLYKNVVYIFPDIAELRVESFTTNFIDLDFKPGQSIMINATDNTNQFGQAPFLNNGKIVQISQVGTNWMRFVDASSLVAEVSWKETVNYRSPYDTISTSFTVTLAVQPVEIARITLTGQTEIEDGRYKVLTTNNGYNVKPKDTFIFKEYDVEEAGIDWVFLNAKRKELLVNAPEIYNFIGSYKAIINSINFFGYNDLIFNEYYRNIDKTSKQFGQLFKVEISDIFNNQVIGFQAKDSIIGLTPNPKYNKTNLFNLTYQITDYQGNSVLAYTLDEVIIKLLGLKGWLMDEVIPIGKRILDITGQTQNVAPITIKHDLKQVFSIDVTDNLAPVNFKIEAYLQPIINNSKTYNVHLSFYTEDNSVPPYFEIKIQTFSTDDDFRKQPFTMRPVQIIREFKTDMKSYNFAADINVDPFIAVEVTTFNGYSEIFTKKRTYSLQSLAFL